ncbi:MAG: LLM class flavin-dependent oxidoreductase, partial [Acidimicrobiales bacterium]
LKGGPISWRGTTRSALSDQRVYPTLEAPLATWVGVGGSPQSVVRAARYQMPLMLAIIGGNPLRFKPLIDLYRDELDAAGSAPLPIGLHSPGYVAESDDEAREELWPYMKQNRDRIGAERGWGPMTRESFDREASEHGSLYVGSPETVARKIARTVSALGVDRFAMKYSAGALPHERLMRCIELYGSKVAPMVREMLEG